MTYATVEPRSKRARATPPVLALHGRTAPLKHVLSAKTIDVDDVDDLCRMADAFETRSVSAPEAAGKTIALLFFQPSTRTRLGFEYMNARGIAAIEAILLELADRALARSLSVPDFCKSVARIDAAVTSLAPSGLAWPEGLSELWNACDWCDDRWTFDNQPHLGSIIEDIRRKLRSKAS